MASPEAPTLRVLALLAAFALLPLAGCFDGATEGARVASLPEGETFGILAEESAFPGTAAYRWSGSLSGKGPSSGQRYGEYAACATSLCRPAADCTKDACDRIPFEVVVPAGWKGALEVSMRFPTDPRPWFALAVEDASGAVVARGAFVYVQTTALTALVPDPAPGVYTAVVALREGESSYEAAAQLEPAPAREGEARDLLPNLVTLPPTDLHVRAPGPLTVGPFVLGPPELSRLAGSAFGSKGCAMGEIVTSQAKRCLRFSNSIGNVGEGPLEIRLALKDGATSPAGGQFAQRVFRTDGSSTTHAAGPAEFHAFHAHWHNAVANEYAVYAYDAATGERGERVNTGTKAGICFADTGLVDLGLLHTTLPAYRGVECWNAASEKEWVMGLSPNWYDIYHYPLADQYVDIAGAPDGTYTLCAVANVEGRLLESDLTDNEGCTPFRLTGDEVELLTPAPYHASVRLDG